MVEIFLDALRSAILISGLVVVMMMLIESLNIDSHGDFFSGLRRSMVGGVVISAFLGAVPGCLGGFASVSLYTHGIISFGALVAMLVASSGDEAFAMLAMFPKQAMWIFAVTASIAIVAGIITDCFYKQGKPHHICSEEFSVHEEDEHHEHHARHFGVRRIAMLVGVVAFVAALLLGLLEDDEHQTQVGLNLLSEQWMYWLFGILSLIVLGVLLFGEDHFVDEHLWHHIVLKHLPSVFCWTFGVLIVLGFALDRFNIGGWINQNTALMILLAAAVGIIPESGPHLVFVTLYASGIVPLPVLLASCISQDGHASLPLLAESKSDFLKAKAINCAVAVAVGFAVMLIS